MKKGDDQECPQFYNYLERQTVCNYKKLWLLLPDFKIVTLRISSWLGEQQMEKVLIKDAA